MNRELLEEPFPPAQIRHRPGRHGESLAYVSGADVVHRLNAALQGAWSFTIVQHEVLDDEVVVLGRLSAGGITKEAFGSSAITRSRDHDSVVSLGDDFKSAATDALKKAATLLGVALHLYTEGSTPPGSASDNSRAKVLAHRRRSPDSSKENASLTHAQLRAIHAIARRLDWPPDRLAEWLRDLAGVQSAEELDKRTASSVIDRLQKEQRSEERDAC